MSGGGVFDSEGSFAGIICGMDASGQVAVLPGNVIAAEYIAFLEEQ